MEERAKIMKTSLSDMRIKSPARGFISLLFSRNFSSSSNGTRALTTRRKVSRKYLDQQVIFLNNAKLPEARNYLEYAWERNKFEPSSMAIEYPIQVSVPKILVPKTKQVRQDSHKNSHRELSTLYESGQFPKILKIFKTTR